MDLLTKIEKKFLDEMIENIHLQDLGEEYAKVYIPNMKILGKYNIQDVRGAALELSKKGYLYVIESDNEPLFALSNSKCRYYKDLIKASRKRWLMHSVLTPILVTILTMGIAAVIKLLWPQIRELVSKLL